MRARVVSLFSGVLSPSVTSVATDRRVSSMLAVDGAEYSLPSQTLSIESSNAMLVAHQRSITAPATSLTMPKIVTAVDDVSNCLPSSVSLNNNERRRSISCAEDRSSNPSLAPSPTRSPTKSSQDIYGALRKLAAVHAFGSKDSRASRLPPINVSTAADRSPSSSGLLSAAPDEGFSKRLKEAVSLVDPLDSEGGFFNRYTASVVSEDTLSESHTSITNENDAEDDEDLTVIQQQQAAVALKVFVGSNGTVANVKVPAHKIARELLQAVLELTNVPQSQEIDSWCLTKIDRNQLLTQVWLTDELLSTTKLHDGDEVRLLNVLEDIRIRYRIPPNSTVLEHGYGFDAAVKDVIEDIQTKNGLCDGTRYGLFLSRVGVWLDEKRRWMSYEVSANDIFDLRAVSQEFLIRIQVPEANTRFAIKVIPSFLVSDVLSIIHSNLESRKICLPLWRRDSDNKLSHYGLFLVQNKTWMTEHSLLSSYNLAETPHEIQFRRQYMIATVEIVTPSFRSLARECGKMQILAAEQTTVLDVLKLLTLEQTSYEEDLSQTLTDEAELKHEFALFTKAGERLKAEDRLWTILDGSSYVDIFEYRSSGRNIKICTSENLHITVSFCLDPYKALSSFDSLILRKFGFCGSFVVTGVRDAQSNTVCDINRSISELRLKEGVALIYELRSCAALSMTSNVNQIWNERKDGTIMYSPENASVVTAATLNKLVEELTTESESGEYLDFMKTFLLTYQSFTTPVILFKKMVQRYHVPWFPAQMSYEEFDKVRQKIQLRVCNVLQQWVKRYQYDFVLVGGVETKSPSNEQNTKSHSSSAKRTLQLMALSFVEGILAYDHPNLARQLRRSIVRLNLELSPRNVMNISQSSPHVSAFMQSARSSDGSKRGVFGHDSEEIARQLTILDFELFSQPYEFLNQSWTKMDAEFRSPNIVAITRRFNAIAFWVVKSILEVKNVRARAKRMSKLADVAEQLFNMNNFSTLMAFVAGFNKSAITRLKFTLKELNARTVKRLAEFEKLMSAESAFKAYRAKLHSVNPPCIPYLGVYLLDLTYIEDGNPNEIGQLINFAKRRLINTLIREVQQYQDQSFKFQRSDELLWLLNESMQIPVFDALESRRGYDSLKQYESKLFEMSLDREPRGAERSQIA